MTPPTLAASKASQPDIVCLADVQAREVSWLWKPYLPFGMLAMLSGDPGCGKTYIALAIAAALTTGRDPGGHTCEPASVLYLSVENAPAEVVRPRFDALEGDASRLHLLTGSKRTENGKEYRRNVTLAGVPLLDIAIQETCARLVIVDPLQSYLGACVDLHRSNETRPVMDGLAKLAEKYGCCILICRHLSKAIGGKAIHRGLGSIDLTGAVRTELLAGSLPDDPKLRVLIQSKNNLGAYGQSLGYEIDEAGRFFWKGPSQVTEAELLAAPSTPEEQSATADAVAWLKDFLSAERKPQQECREKSELAGYSYATLRRAKISLRVRSSKVKMTGAWFWGLPDEGVHEDAHKENLSTFANLSPFEDAQENVTTTKVLNVSPLDIEGAQKNCVSTLLSTFPAVSGFDPPHRGKCGNGDVTGPALISDADDSGLDDADVSFNFGWKAMLE